MLLPTLRALAPTASVGIEAAGGGLAMSNVKSGEER